jgi:hypothetical protein
VWGGVDFGLVQADFGELRGGSWLLGMGPPVWRRIHHAREFSIVDGADVHDDGGLHRRAGGGRV